MAPELVLGVLDQLNEGDEESPGMGALGDESLQQHTRNLLLDALVALGLIEEVECNAREVVRVAGRVSELVGDGIEAHIPAAIVQLHELLKDLHLRRAAETAGDLAVILLEAGKALHADIEDERVDLGRIQLLLALLAEVGNHVIQKVRRMLVAEVAVQLVLEKNEGGDNIGEDERALRDLRKLVNLEIAGDGVVEGNALGNG
mmetsp:Transcript_45539/g.96821  ORF Transcript_45539/g.96821 Transcript_45539/m.96821 type:complete len:203 (-) Transcript_45539:4056-4664(-)